MAQLTLYLDEETHIRMKQLAREAGVSQSRWVGNLIRQTTRVDWPDLVREIGGSWPDAPSAEDLRSPSAEDVERESL